MGKRADDLRQHPRVDARLAMQLADETMGDNLVTTESLNISRGGVYCESAEFLAPLSRVALTVVLPPFGTAARSRVLRSEGVVVRCENLPPARGRKRYQLACCFTGLDAEMRSLLDSFVTWRASRRSAPLAARHAAQATKPRRRPAATKKIVRKVAAKSKAATPKAAARTKKAGSTAAGRTPRPKPRGTR
jgi:hypothetical protein